MMEVPLACELVKEGVGEGLGMMEVPLVCGLVGDVGSDGGGTSRL